jgi:hypothetical protein
MPPLFFSLVGASLLATFAARAVAVASKLAPTG